MYSVGLDVDIKVSNEQVTTQKSINTLYIMLYAGNIQNISIPCGIIRYYINPYLYTELYKNYKKYLI